MKAAALSSAAEFRASVAIEGTFHFNNHTTRNRAHAVFDRHHTPSVVWPDCRAAYKIAWLHRDYGVLSATIVAASWFMSTHSC